MTMRWRGHCRRCPASTLLLRCSSKPCLPRLPLAAQPGPLAGGKLVILNLQQTPKDRRADLVIHSRCDQVMQQVMARLALPIPAYTRTDTAVLHCQASLHAAHISPAQHRVTLELRNVHDSRAAPPLLASASIAILQVSAHSRVSLSSQAHRVPQRLHFSPAAVAGTT